MVALELMDWKGIESGAEQQIRDSLIQRQVGRILLKEAIRNIKSLGGKTNVEINKEHKEEIKKNNIAG